MVAPAPPSGGPRGRLRGPDRDHVAVHEEERPGAEHGLGPRTPHVATATRHPWPLLPRRPSPASTPLLARRPLHPPNTCPRILPYLLPTAPTPPPVRGSASPLPIIAGRESKLRKHGQGAPGHRRAQMVRIDHDLADAGRFSASAKFDGAAAPAERHQAAWDPVGERAVRVPKPAHSTIALTPTPAPGRRLPRPAESSAFSAQRGPCAARPPHVEKPHWKGGEGQGRSRTPLSTRSRWRGQVGPQGQLQNRLRGQQRAVLLLSQLRSRPRIPVFGVRLTRSS